MRTLYCNRKRTSDVGQTGGTVILSGVFPFAGEWKDEVEGPLRSDRVCISTFKDESSNRAIREK